MHYNYKLDFACEVYIVYNNHVLLRHHEKYNRWLAVGGHVDPGEDFDECAMREVREEVGLVINLISAIEPECQHSEDEGYRHLKGPLAINRHSITKSHDHVALVFAATSSTMALELPDGPEGDAECRWFTLDELRSNPTISQTVIGYAEKALVIASRG